MQVHRKTLNHQVYGHQCDLRWPTSAVLGSSAETGKNGAILTETQARLASGWPNDIHHGHLDVSPSGDREDWPLPSIFSLVVVTDQVGSHYTRVEFCSHQIPFSLFACLDDDSPCQKAGTWTSDRGSDGPLPPCYPLPTPMPTQRREEIAAQGGKP